MHDLKRCRRCNEEKPRDAFYTGRARCKQCMSEEWRERYATDPDFAQRQRGRARRHREAHPQKVAARKRDYYERNRDQEAARAQAHYKQNREKRREQIRAWQKENPDRVALYARRQRTQRATAVPDHEYTAILLGDPCSYCGGPADGPDHIVPIRAGGDGSPENLTAACTDCNRSKNQRSLLDFMLVSA